MTREAKTGLIAGGRLAPIFLESEPVPSEFNLAAYSRAFYERHREVMPQGFGMVSGIWQLGPNGKRELPPHEAISFDARDSSESVFEWMIGYGEAGAQKIVRLLASPDAVEGLFVETTVQGSVLRHFELNEAELALAQGHLASRLSSEEVFQSIQEAYEQRLGLGKQIGRLAAEQAQELAKYKSPSRSISRQIETQSAKLANTGFAPLAVFDLQRLNRAAAPGPHSR